jgi:mRNA-degrading endonuclease RelE of RelBE toxin-antitoxin system
MNRREDHIVWDVIFPSNWKKQVKALPHHTQKKLLSYMNEIILERDPTFAATFKKGTKYGHVYVAELSNSHRLSYTINYNTKTIEIIRVGDHKGVYGKD